MPRTPSTTRPPAAARGHAAALGLSPIVARPLTGSARGKRALAAFCAMTRPLLAVVALAILKAPMAQAAMRRSLAPPEEIEPAAPEALTMQRRFRRRRVVGSSIATDDRFELTTLGFCSILSALPRRVPCSARQISLSAIAGVWDWAAGSLRGRHR